MHDFFMGPQSINMRDISKWNIYMHEFCVWGGGGNHMSPTPTPL